MQCGCILPLCSRQSLCNVDWCLRASVKLRTIIKYLVDQMKTLHHLQCFIGRMLSPSISQEHSHYLMTFFAGTLPWSIATEICQVILYAAEVVNNSDLRGYKFTDGVEATLRNSTTFTFSSISLHCKSSSRPK